MIGHEETRYATRSLLTMDGAESAPRLFFAYFFGIFGRLHGVSVPPNRNAISQHLWLKWLNGLARVDGGAGLSATLRFAQDDKVGVGFGEKTKGAD
jgi:hypothetical protein